jgi:hypothetical protein
MLIQLINILNKSGEEQLQKISPALHYFQEHNFNSDSSVKLNDELLGQYALLDDFDIFQTLKYCQNSTNKVISTLATGLVNRKIFRIELSSEPTKSETIADLKRTIKDKLNLNLEQAEALVLTGSESNQSYNLNQDEIKILFKNGEVKPISEVSDHFLDTKLINKHFICYPRV